jgi:GTPase Era involved in 16S rRNA processing
MQFINALLGTRTMKVGHTLDPCTTNIQYAIHDIPNRPDLNGRRIVIVDTPGFHDTPTAIHKRIARWLASS